MECSYDRQTPGSNMCKSMGSHLITEQAYSMDSSGRSGRACRRNALQKKMFGRSSESSCRQSSPQTVTSPARNQNAAALSAGPEPMGTFAIFAGLRDHPSPASTAVLSSARMFSLYQSLNIPRSIVTSRVNIVTEKTILIKQKGEKR